VFDDFKTDDPLNQNCLEIGQRKGFYLQIQIELVTLPNSIIPNNDQSLI